MLYKMKPYKDVSDYWKNYFSSAEGMQTYYDTCSKCKYDINEDNHTYRVILNNKCIHEEELHIIFPFAQSLARCPTLLHVKNGAYYNVPLDCLTLNSLNFNLY